MAEHRAGAATEQPTAERRRRARREGEVAISADLTAALGLGAVAVVLAIAAPAGTARLLGYFRNALSQAAAAPAVGVPALASAGRAAFAVAAPLVLVPGAAALLAALLAGSAQTGGLFTWSAVRPRWRRLAPRALLRRLFVLENAAPTGRALLKVALLFVAAGLFLRDVGPALPGLSRANAGAIVSAAGHLSLQLVVRLVVALAVWGAVDWMLARWRHHRALAMTRDEIRREEREREGDPRHRAERRRAHGALSREATPEDSKSADFVVTGAGSVTVAVAIAYDRAGGRAPTVVVTGRGSAAALMVRTAQAAGVPVHDDAPLAQALLDTPAGDEIPETCFEAVAVLLP